MLVLLGLGWWLHGPRTALRRWSGRNLDEPTCERVNQARHAEDELTSDTSQGDFISDVLHQFGISASYFALRQDKLELFRVRQVNGKWLEKRVR
jgi:hypothetical protein